MNHDIIAHTTIFEVCFRRGVTYEQLCGPKQSKRISHARGEIATALKRRTSMTLCEIAAMFNRRDHSTVISWMKTWAKHSGDYASKNPDAMCKEDIARNMTEDEWNRHMQIVAMCERLDAIESKIDEARTADDSARLVYERVHTIESIRKLVKANRVARERTSA